MKNTPKFNLNDKEEFVIAGGALVRVRHWKIEKTLGEGATATVYLARSLLNYNERVAIKVFKPEYFADATFNESNQKMMRTEAALVGKIFHPNILQTYNVGAGGTQKYLIMEFAEGGCLDERINPPHHFNLSKIIQMFFQCGTALQYSDEISVIHRDIKPANILLTRSGDPKITDFGSSMVKGMDHAAVSGVGSPSYMSSEQIRQIPLNQQTDIYSLGASFFEVVTGRKTFVADNQQEMIRQILFVEPAPISHFIKSRLPDGLEAIISKCLKKKQEDRYPTWGRYLHDMARLIYSITPLQKRVCVVDDVAAFDDVRACKTMDIFEDSELWDLIQGGLVERIACGMAFSIEKMVETKKEEIRQVNLKHARLETDDDRRKPIKPPKTKMNFTFVLRGAIQSYGNGEDRRIQVLESGDFCANISLIEQLHSDTPINAYSIDQTVIITLNEDRIESIHPVVRDKINLLIRQSQDRQAQILRRRHAKLDIHQAVKDASRGLELL